MLTKQQKDFAFGKATAAAIGAVGFIGLLAWRNYGWLALLIWGLIVVLAALVILLIMTRPGRGAKGS